MMPDNGQERRSAMLEFAKTLFDSGYKWISKSYISIKRFICKSGGKVVLLIAKILIEKLIEKLIEALIEHLL